MSSASGYELPADDPAALVEAVRLAAAGKSVRLVRDGQPVVDVVPPGTTEAQRRSLEIEQDIIELGSGRAPSPADYRRVYEQLGEPYPGDDVILHAFPDAA